MEAVCRECEVCQRSGRAKPRPLFDSNIVSTFNATVCLDIVFWGQNDKFLVITDALSRFVVCEPLRTKSRGEVAIAFLHRWICNHGLPGQVVCDAGSEFLGDFVHMCDALGVRIRPAAARKQSMNGLVERKIGELKGHVQRLLGDNPRLSLRHAAHWAVHAANSLPLYGTKWSARECAFGSGAGPAVEPELRSLRERLHQNIIASFGTAEEAAQALSTAALDERVRNAIRSQGRATSAEYEQGDKVWHREEKHWKPGTIVGKSGQQDVLIRNNSNKVKVFSPTDSSPGACFSTW